MCGGRVEGQPIQMCGGRFERGRVGAPSSDPAAYARKMDERSLKLDSSSSWTPSSHTGKP
eukprot:7198483-Prymnesium_polylepis.1